MTKDELIAKQQIQIEEYESLFRENAAIKQKLKGMMYNIGAPLNDNVLQFNSRQLIWAISLAEAIGEINILNPDQ